MEKDELKKDSIINHMCYYFNDINRFEVFYFDNTLLNEKSLLHIMM